MYFLNTVGLLSSTLAAVHDGPYNTATPTPSTLYPDFSTYSSLVRQTETVIVTLTHTIAPSTTALSLPTPTKPTSGFAIPPSAPIADAGEAGVIYTCIKPEHGTGNRDALGLLPIVTRDESLVNDTRGPMFTLGTPVISCISHYTPSKIVPTATTGSPAVSKQVSGSAFSHSDYTASTSPSPSPSSLPEEDVIFFMLPIANNSPSSASSGFYWPATSALPTTTTNSQDDNKVAWAGTDNAIASQVKDCPLSDVSPLLLQSKSAKSRRAQRPWQDWIRREPRQEAKIPQDSVGEGQEKRECRHCDQEGAVLCRGDVAIGICRGGCMEMQMIGRGKGNGCEDF